MPIFTHMRRGSGSKSPRPTGTNAPDWETQEEELFNEVDQGGEEPAALQRMENHPSSPSRLRGKPSLAVRPGEGKSLRAEKAPGRGGAPALDDRVNLHARISGQHHARLKIQAILTHQSVVKLIESWIEMNCPEI